MAKAKTIAVPPPDGREPFLAAIRANPNDDAPRLVYADWLDEHGEADRAELIRLQIEQARLPKHDVRAGPQQRRIQQVERRVKSAIFKGLPRDWHSATTFKRGFIERLWTSPRLFIQAGQALFAREWVHQLDVRPRTNERPTLLLESPLLMHLDSLAFGHARLESDGARLVAECQHLAHLRELDLIANYIRDDGIERLAASPYLSNLRHLSIKYNDAFAVGAKAIAESPYLQNLTHLNISCNEIGPEGLQAICNAAFAPKLEQLHVEGNPGYEPLLRTEGMRILAQAKSLRGLQELDLQSNEIGDAGCVALAKAKHFKNLKRLSLQDNGITAKGVTALLAAPFARQLEELNLRSNNLSTLVATDFARVRLPRLKKLDLGNCSINAESMAVLATSSLFATVEELSLDNNVLRDAGIKAFAASPHLTNLIDLNLCDCEIRSDGARALAKAVLPNLRHLWISYNRLSSGGVLALAKAKWLNNLGTLSMSGIDFTAKAAQALANVQPMANLYYFYCNGSIPDEAKQILKNRFKRIVGFS